MYNGILIFDKPEDFTSHDVVAKLRGILRQKKIGHGGTLDPMATGVLPVFLGSATSAAEYITCADKRYIAGFRLGIGTDTQDITGRIIKQTEVRAGREQVLAALDSFRGEISQIPPMYSAVKKNGKRLYDLARQGIELEREPRRICIKKLELISANGADYIIDVVCSKGTYIRTLCSDIGDFLGCGAAMTSLRRIRSGSFGCERAVGFEFLQQAVQNGSVQSVIIPTDMLFCEYPSVIVDPRDLKRALNGAWLRLAEQKFDFIPENAEKCRVYSEDRRFIMLGKIKDDGDHGKIICTEKMFYRED